MKDTSKVPSKKKYPPPQYEVWIWADTGDLFHPDIERVIFKDKKEAYRVFTAMPLTDKIFEVDLEFVFLDPNNAVHTKVSKVINNKRRQLDLTTVDDIKKLVDKIAKK